MLIADSITVGYGSPVLQDVTLTISPGEIVGLGGESGSGKTTLAATLAGLRTPDAGRVTVDGVPPRRARGTTAMVFQSPRAATNPHLTVAQIIAEPARIHRRPIDIPALATSVGLTPDLLDRRPHTLSEGQLQRACLARALAQNPRYLLLDEPTAMLDAATTAAVIRLVVEHATTLGVLLISHDPALLEVACTRVHTLHKGTLSPQLPQAGLSEPI
ncbi:ABC transporter ATP-binding protein [Nocardia coubleae]|uniref:ATP-binding cassette domain-containing protein n=1 Tax=Nocardia coubleae TaxID=356147 RepID=A0A846W5G9_9NOCA|nr:ATP-binding cassette domain-containing protein [Nocardia coubleae]NKX88325.1 ATP-binding cassette domain-containing protein [Nocardia coubleae]